MFNTFTTTATFTTATTQFNKITAINLGTLLLLYKRFF